MPRNIVLTRERYEVLLGLCQGLVAEEMAANLQVSPHTVKTRLRELYATLGVERAYDAINRAWRVGILRTCPVCRRPREEGAGSQAPFADPAMRKATFQAPMEQVPELTIEDVSGTADPLLMSHQPRSPLTSGMTETLRMLAAGYSNAEIAKSLTISQNTVRTNLHRLYLILNVHDRGEAVAQGFIRGYVKEEHVRFYREGK